MEQIFRTSGPRFSWNERSYNTTRQTKRHFSKSTCSSLSLSSNDWSKLRHQTPGINSEISERMRFVMDKTDWSHGPIRKGRWGDSMFQSIRKPDQNCLIEYRIEIQSIKPHQNSERSWSHSARLLRNVFMVFMDFHPVDEMACLTYKTAALCGFPDIVGIHLASKANIRQDRNMTSHYLSRILPFYLFWRLLYLHGLFLTATSTTGKELL